MAHYNATKQNTLMNRIRLDYAKYIRELVKIGNAQDIIEYVNYATVKTDMVVLLGRNLTPAESVALLQAPENNTRFGKKFVKAHSTCKSLQDSRQLLRRMLREFEANKRTIKDKLGSINAVLKAYAG